jgi:copper homeostasis protein (lipoprotein)
MKRIASLAVGVTAFLAWGCGHRSDCDSACLTDDEELETFVYEGLIPESDSTAVVWLLSLQEVAEDSIGTYLLSMTYAQADENGNPQTTQDDGSVLTLVGIPNDSTAVVYQLVSSSPVNPRVNLLSEGDSALQVVDARMQPVDTTGQHRLVKKN